MGRNLDMSPAPFPFNVLDFLGGSDGSLLPAITYGTIGLAIITAIAKALQ